MRLLDLSYRYKTPLWGGLLVIVTTVVVSASLMFKAYDDMREDLFIRSSGLGQRLAESLFQPMMEQDLWRLFEVINRPFESAHEKDILMPDTILILDNNLKVVVSTRPKEIPLGASVDKLSPEYAHLMEPMANSVGLARARGELQDKKNFYVMTPIVNEGYRVGTVIVVHSRDSLWPRFVRIATHGALTGLLVLAVLLPSSWYWGGRLSRPLVLIADRMKSSEAGTFEDIDATVYPYKDEVGDLFNAYRRMQTERSAKRALEEQVVQSERLAAVGHLAAGVAHEINNPLGGMLTAIDTLRAVGQSRNREFDARTAKTISLIERGLTQIKETVSALLVESRVKTRHLEPRDFEDIRSLVLPQVQNKQVQLVWKASLARSIPLQANQVRQVLINLLLNAIHAANESGEVSCSIAEQNSALQMVIENDGKLLSSKQMSHLYEPFSPLSRDGHGLGLWVTYQIVEQLGGRIGIDQLQGHVRFTVTLPFQEIAAA
jgi:signal transduction histidine kinase